MVLNCLRDDRWPIVGLRIIVLDFEALLPSYNVSLLTWLKQCVSGEEWQRTLCQNLEEFLIREGQLGCQWMTTAIPWYFWTTYSVRTCQGWSLCSACLILPSSEIHFHVNCELVRQFLAPHGNSGKADDEDLQSGHEDISLREADEESRMHKDWRAWGTQPFSSDTIRNEQWHYASR